MAVHSIAKITAKYLFDYDAPGKMARIDIHHQGGAEMKKYKNMKSCSTDVS